MALKTFGIRMPITFLTFCVLLNFINPIASSSKHAHPHTRTSGSDSRLKKRTCQPRKGPSGPALSQSYSGEGTFHPTAGGGGNCAFTKWPVPKEYGPVAIASNRWDSAKACGACLEIQGPGGTFIGIVNDQCPSCQKNGLDLDKGIWKKLSKNKDPGIIQIKWKIVPCGFSKPMSFMNKTGVSEYWNSIQVQGSNTPLKGLEVSTNGGPWMPLDIQTNSNYYQPKDGKGLGKTGDIRVTCLSGKQFITKNVDLAKPESPNPASENC